MQHFHYIFTGTGLSTLMTVREMIVSGKFKNQSILLLDLDSKKNNDRTWCFWEKKESFPDLINKNWAKALFKSESIEKKMDLNPYQYSMLKGLVFYKSTFDLIAKELNITFLQQKVINFEELGSHCLVKTETQSFTCNRIINSIFNPEIVKKQLHYPLLSQHFIGWFIKSNEPVFNSNCATFMDFSVAQKGNTRFMYVLPFSDNEALIEYTLFSKDLLEKNEYEIAIKSYIEKLGITDYEIVEKEQGNIPMTCYPFWKHNTKNIVNIGSAGGWTKASTGFTFKNTNKKSKALVSFLKTEKDFTAFHSKDKFWFYDLLLLDILHRRNELGSVIFSTLFQKVKSILIFKFLDEETSFWEDIQVLWKCPKGVFIGALLRRILGLR
jgi:lycopene beta-cyclase